MLTRASLRAFSTQALKVVNDVAKQRYVVIMKGEEAQLFYETEGNKITFVSTEVPEVFQGKGIGKVLAKHAFDEALAQKTVVVCKCHFLAKYYENNKLKYKGLKVIMELEEPKK